MELNREEIIKSLECCEQNNCRECPSRGNCHELHSYALALIKELIEENEKLVDDLIEQSIENVMLLMKQKRVKVDTVRKMQTMFEERLDISTCGYSTDEVISDVLKTLERVTEEILEDKIYEDRN